MRNLSIFNSLKIVPLFELLCAYNCQMIRQSTIEKYVGKRFNRFTVLEFVRREGSTVYFFKCKCDCGTVGEYRIGSLVSKTGTVSCGCFTRERNATAHTGNTYRRLGFSEGAANRLFDRYKADAIKKGVSFELDKDAFLSLSKGECFYCKTPPAQIHVARNGYGNYVFNGVDRVNNAVGYKKENCVSCCKRCNGIKNGVSKEMVVKIYNFLLSKGAITK